MSKKLEFDLTVNSNALLCPNPKEFFALALLGINELDEMRIVPNVKDKSKIAFTTFGRVLQAYTCEFTPSEVTVDAIDIEVCPLSIMTEVCQSDIESSFMADWMRAGSNEADFGPAQFMAWYYEQLQFSIKNDVAELMWQGDTDGSTFPECDGFEKKFSEDGTVIPTSGATTVTASNVIAEINKVLALLPPAISQKKSELRLYVSSNVATAYQQAVAATAGVSGFVYFADAAPLAYSGIKMVVCEGMSPNTMVCTLRNNLIFVTDLRSDLDEIFTVNFKSTRLVDKIGTKTNIKVGFFYTNPTQIVVYLG